MAPHQDLSPVRGFLYLKPNDSWLEKHEKLIGTMVIAPTFQTLEGKKVSTVEESEEGNIKYHEYENGFFIKEYVVG